MTTQEKIQKAEERIKELEVLIYYWKNEALKVSQTKIGKTKWKVSPINEIRAA